MLNELISLKSPKSQAAEAFRTLRTNIQFSSSDEKFKKIVVTSAQPNEGKSTVISNLAITMAQSGKKVLLVDCDLRKPSIHKRLELSNKNGLTTFLATEKIIDECIQTISVSNFQVITSGPIPPNPAELIDSKKMRKLLEDLSKVYDVILIDAPPVLAVTDTQILATMCEGVIFVASYGEADKHAVVRARELIEKVEARILGVVINKVPNVESSYYYNYEYNK
jgi:capsular exopolysaccharide synthesis family protein